MSPIVQKMIDVGLEPILLEAIDCIGEVRMKYGTNDIVIFALVEEDGSAEVRASLREEVVPLMQSEFSGAENANKLLSKPLPPDRFAMVIFDLRGDAIIYSLSLPIKGTLGVLN